MKIDGSRVLFFHSPVWHSFFVELLGHLMEERGCSVGVIATKGARPTYQKLMEQGAELFEEPDFSLNGDSETGGETGELADSLRECENKLERSAGRIQLTAERTFGRGFSSDFYFWPKNSYHSSIRQNNLPEQIVLRQHRFCEEILDAFQPDWILGRANCGPLPHSMVFASNLRGIPFVTGRFSKVLSGRAFWTTDLSMYNTDGVRIFEEKKAAKERASSRSLEFIGSFRSKPETVEYIRNNWAVSKKGVLRRRVWTSLLRQVVWLRDLVKGEAARRPSAFSPIWEIFRMRINKGLERRFFNTFTPTELKETKYIYYPLHKEPELMLNFQSPLWHDQRHAVKFLSSMLPSGYRLLIKEHRFNVGRRPLRYHRFLSQLPGVSLIDPFDDQFKYLKNADLIVTDTGSSGWEGLLLSKRVVTIEKTFYDPVGLATKVRDATRMDASFLEALQSDDPETGGDNTIGLFIDAEQDSTVEIEEMQKDCRTSIPLLEGILERSTQS